MVLTFIFFSQTSMEYSIHLHYSSSTKVWWPAFTSLSCSLFKIVILAMPSSNGDLIGKVMWEWKWDEFGILRENTIKSVCFFNTNFVFQELTNVSHTLHSKGTQEIICSSLKVSKIVEKIYGKKWWKENCLKLFPHFSTILTTFMHEQALGINDKMQLKGS